MELEAQLQFFERIYERARRFRQSQSRHSKVIQGEGVDFGGQRPYLMGDDFRRIDWKAQARLEKWIVLETERTQERRLEIGLDSSPSMACGAPKLWPWAQLIAGALAAFGLGRGVAVRVRQSVKTQRGFLRGRGKLLHLTEMLLRGRGEWGDWTEFRDLVFEGPQVGHDLLLVSDGFWPKSWQDSFRRLGARRRRMFVLILRPEFELNPDLLGESGIQLNFAEASRPSNLILSLTRPVLRAMSRRRDQHVFELQQGLKSLGMGCQELNLREGLEVQALEKQLHSVFPRLF